MVDFFPFLALKKETTYLTDAVPTVIANAYLTRNFDYEPAVVDMLGRNLDLPARGGLAGVPTNKRTMFSFELELQGSGAAGTAPRWMEALEYCGMAAPTLTASTKAEQKFAALGVALSAASAYYWVGDQQHKALGARGDISTIDFTAGAYPFIAFDFMGLPPAATPFTVATPAAPTLTAWKDPIEVSTANTSFTLDGYAAVLRSFKAKANADVKLRNLVGSNYVQRGNHSLDCSIVIEAPSFATKNYITSLLAGTRVAVQIIHGTAAGYIVQLDAGFLQIKKVKPQSEDDILMYAIDADLTISAGQDDILLTAK